MRGPIRANAARRQTKSKLSARRLAAAAAAFSFCFILSLSVSATGFAGSTPSGVDTSSMDGIVSIVFWLVRIIVGAAGAIPSIIKLVQGQTDDNTRDRNAGITGLVITFAGIAATFGVEQLF